MLTLFLDFGSSQHVIGLIQEDRTLVLREVAPKTDETLLMPMITELLSTQKLKAADLNRIACVTGPGGFMSLRVGVSLANTLAWSLKIPLAGIHLADLWAPRLSQGSLWIHSTKKDLVFVRRLGNEAEPILMTIDALSQQIKKETLYVGELMDEQKKRIPLLQPEPNALALTQVLPPLLKNLVYGNQSLMPWYGRSG